MEEEVGIKVTRLRRRLSVESDDVKSPSTPSTPTKKRGGRLAAKPQLELIDENATEAAPKRTRKSTSRDIVEPIEEKAVTPARRSTRIKSNTSIVSDTVGDTAEDKGTPSRRSTRIKSNTSIIAEAVQNVNSPRAKRAARRTSQVGSDNEAPGTPARQTRRTRKDSTSSVDKQAEPNADILVGQVNEVIVEESENVNETKITNNPNSDSPTLRKSPRLVEKTGRKGSSLKNDDKENQPQTGKDASETETTNDSDKSMAETKTDQRREVIEQNNLSVESSNLIKELNEAPKKVKNNLNKSTTAVAEPQIKSKRNRTKSWTTISVDPSNEPSFCSDSEATKKKRKNYTLNLSNLSGSGDGIMNISYKNNKENKEQENKPSLNLLTSFEKKKKKQHEKSLSEDTETSVPEVLNSSVTLNKSEEPIPEDNAVSKNVSAKDSLNSSKIPISSVTEQLLEQRPSGHIQSLIYIEDSDSNNSNTKGNTDKNFDSGDQCVPVVDHHLEDKTSKEPNHNLSYEPMDIDETMPENVSLTTFGEKNNSICQIDKEPGAKDESINKSKTKYKISEMLPDDTVNEESNKSQRKSSVSTIADNAVVDKDSNKSKRKSSISNVVSEDTTDGVSNISMGKKFNKSNRKSSISNVETGNEGSNMSLNKSTIPNTANDDKMNKVYNDSNRKSSISNIVVPDVSINDKSRKSMITGLADQENVYKSLNKSKRKSSISPMVAEVSMNKRNSSILDRSNNVDDILNKSSNKSKRKSSVSNISNNGDSLDKGFKSKRKSSISPMEPDTFNKTENENKSTLVLSQIKDVVDSEINSETNVPKDSDESNEQLSKSANVPNVITEKEFDKKNLSLTYLTSTPLQQKSITKLGMQINSSIITPNSVSKIDTKNTLKSSKKEASILSQENDSDSSEEEDSEEESSLEKSKLIDEEAEEASVDYESGDSRDEDEKEYEEQHEIVDKGETLESEEENEYSDDSDYEKDSFIVSSDDEDEELLSGSGDDLSMNAEELSMSAKSKKKYNERKIKEQKKASREMYEARHKLKESENNVQNQKSSKSKKNNRQRFDTSSSDSDDEVAAQPKKNRRQRIDSSQDINMLQSDADKSLSKKKQKPNKTKRLSQESDDAISEKEVTIREETQTDKIDPLALQNVIKEEPKTPQKDLNISTVAVNYIEEVEEVHIDENISMMKSNQTSDPLQATNAQDDLEDDDDEGSISENEEIIQNYESVLSNLNKANSKKIKSLDISLNLDKKTKQKAKEAIVDELNLTQVKKSTKKKDAPEKTAAPKKLEKSLSNKSTDKVEKQVNVFSESSSDSIDMKLLFPEDSNDSEVVVVKNNENTKNPNANETSKKEVGQDIPEDFIPLKRTEGKTNILENMDTANKSKDESILNVSKKKKNKLKSAHTEQAITINDEENENASFFIDTTGTHTETNKTEANTSIKNSAKKNKQRNNVSFTNVEEATVDDDSNDAPLEVSYRSEKKKNKSIQDINTTQNKDGTQVDIDAVGTPSQSGKKKKNKKMLNSSQNVTELSMIDNAEDAAAKSVNTFVINVNDSAKKKGKKMSVSQTEEVTENKSEELVQNVSLGSAKKQKQKTISESSALDKENVDKEDDNNVIHDEEFPKKRKRKSSANQTIDEIVFKDDVKLDTSKTLNVSLPTVNLKKKVKIFHNVEDIQAQVQDSDTETQEQEKAPVKKAKKKNKAPQHQELDEINDEAAKKNKKRKERDDDDAGKISKVLKQNSLDKVHVPRLPANVLKQLGDKPKEDIMETKKAKVISTTSFMVQESRKKRNKPSNYLEESVYLNDDMEEKKRKGVIKNPKVLPFIPTASTSDNGFTTDFTVNIIPQQTQFVAQSNDIANFKNDYLQKKRIKKLGTFEMYKRLRNIKISKF